MALLYSALLINIFHRFKIFEMWVYGSEPCEKLYYVNLSTCFHISSFYVSRESTNHKSFNFS